MVRIALYTWLLLFTCSIDMPTFGISKSILSFGDVCTDTSVILRFRNPFNGGDGSQDDPYQVATVEQLDSVRNFRNAYFHQTSDVDLDTFPYNQGQGWEPIGSQDNPFRGSYDGGGFTISGLFINRPNDENQGLFGFMDSGSLENVRLINASVLGRSHIGILIGSCISVNIANCFSSGSVAGVHQVGGLIGRISALYSAYHESTVFGCSSEAVVTGRDDLPIERSMIGGLIGFAQHIVIGSCSYASPLAPPDSGIHAPSSSMVGGLVGYLDNDQTPDTKIINSNATGKITGLDQSGGLVGKVHDRNAGFLLDNSSFEGVLIGRNDVGGLIGIVATEMRQPQYVITNCFSISEISSTNQNNVNIGGLIGRVITQGNSQTNPIALTSSCYAKPTITGNDSQHVGGFIGRIEGNNRLLIKNCYTSSGEITGTDHIGGLIGSMQSVTVKNSYSAIEVDSNGNNSGGLIGSVSGNNVLVENSYWDTEVSTQANSALGEGRATAQMTSPHNENTYVDWDFAHIWHEDFDDEINGGYPFLSGTGFNEGDGSENNPFLVRNSQELNKVRYHFDSHFIQMNDIDVNHAPWIPIGCNNAPFSGTYNGNNNTINNLSVSRIFDAGLFGVISNATIKNLIIADAGAFGISRIGILVGSASNGSMLVNCGVSGEVYGHIAGSDVGVLVGYGNDVTIEKCYSVGNITQFNANAGGLVGHLENNSNVTKCYSIVDVASGDVDHPLNAGGLIGKISESSVSNSYSAGHVEDVWNSGGLIGLIHDSSISNSYWDFESSGQIRFVLPGSGMYGKTTTQMLQLKTFTGWELNSVTSEPVWGNWSTYMGNPYIGKTYPHLMWEERPQEHHYPVIPKTVKIFRNNRLVHWDSFPRMTAQGCGTWNETVALLGDLLDPDTGLATVVSQDSCMAYDYWAVPEPIWNPDQGVILHRPKGYKLGFTDYKERLLHIPGDRFNVTVTLEPGLDNWVGYWEYETQPLLDAISHIAHRVHSIRGQDGGYYRCDQEEAWLPTIHATPSDFDTKYTFYGKMYLIRLKDNDPGINDFTWATTRSRPENIARIFERPEPEYFSFRDKPRYEEFFIEEIENDEGLLEIGVFVGEECIGAAVFEGRYPISLLAYTDDSHTDREVYFVLYREKCTVNEVETKEYIKVVEARNNRTGEYSRQQIKPLQQSYTMILLGAGDYTESTVTPQVVMGQNFPNPFVTSTTAGSVTQNRSESSIVTTIPIYLSTDMDVDISVFNIKGQRVKTFTSGNLTAGKHTLIWDGRNERNRPVASGVYFYKLQSDIETINKKMLIIR